MAGVIALRPRSDRISSEVMTATRKMAGPVLRSGEMALAAIDAIKEDNPDKEIVVVDHGAYLRIEADGGLVLTRQTMEACIGRPFVMQEIEGALIGFSGQIDQTADAMRWYFNSPRVS